MFDKIFLSLEIFNKFLTNAFVPNKAPVTNDAI